MKIGAQFYTLREFCKTPEGLSEALKKVADIGYTTVQISGTCFVRRCGCRAPQQERVNAATIERSIK